MLLTDTVNAVEGTCVTLCPSSMQGSDVLKQLLGRMKVGAIVRATGRLQPPAHRSRPGVLDVVAHDVQVIGQARSPAAQNR